MTRLALTLLRTRWGIFILAIAAAVVGALALVFTTPAHYVQINGAVASYTVVNNAAGSYDHNELRLAGDPAVYKLDDGEYTPAPPDAIPAGTQVSVWVDQGHPWIMAIRLPDASGAGAHLYTTFPYDHPDQNLLIGRIVGGAFEVLALGLAIWGALWRQARKARFPKTTYTPTYMAPGMYDHEQPR